MKKLLVMALLVGVLISLFSQTREFYYVSALLVFGAVFFSLKKWPLSLTDMLVLFLITVPLHTLRFGSEEHFIRLSEIAFIPLFLWWLAQVFLKKSNQPLTIRKEFIFLLAYLMINIVSINNSILPVISASRCLILAYLFLFTYMITDIVNNKERLNAVIKATLIISSFSAIIACLQSVFPEMIIFTPVPLGKLFGVTFYRAGVGWHDPNYYALYMAMNAALCLSCLFSNDKNSRLLKICFMLQIAGILATFSRTAFISLILVILYLLHYFGKRKLFLGALFLIIAAALTVSLNAMKIYEKNSFLASTVYRVADKNRLESQPTLVMGHRYAAFKANWAMFLDHPLLGVGPFMAMYNFDKYRPLRILRFFQKTPLPPN